MKTKIFAHYLPQFHRIRENSEWWGPGFTEWTNVAKCRELFPGHYQPDVPADLGFYDLSRVDIMHEQAQLAREHGVDGFNFYFYWFDGRRILEKPLENFLESDVDIEFSLCWANENWTRRWDGADKEVLLEQSYRDGFEVGLFSELLPYFKDKRYLRIGGNPALSIYRPQEIPNVTQVFENLRRLAVENGLPGLHIIAVESFGLPSPSIVGADAMMEFPPHGVGSQSITGLPPGTIEGFTGQALDYRRAILNAVEKPKPDFIYYRGLMPSWDNSARTGKRAHFFLNSDPHNFRIWLDFALAWTSQSFDTSEQGLVFINAWNEWAEGAHLEPDLRFGKGFLTEVRESALQPLSVQAARRAVNRLVPGTRDAQSGNSISVNTKGILSFSRALISEINSNNLKQVFRLLRQDPSCKELIYALREGFGAVVRVNGNQWRPSSYVFEGEKNTADLLSKILFTVHMHYPEYVARFCKLVESMPMGGNFAVTTDSRKIFDELTSKNFPNVKVLLTENRGRNFGPLLVELRKEIQRFEFAIHLHSKRSVHSTRSVARRWADLHWLMLAEDKDLLERTIQLMWADRDIAVAYPLVTKVVGPTGFNWFKNKELARSWFRKHNLSFVEDPFAFPAGGMFMINTSAFEVLLNKEWKYADFPAETGQLDGTTHHMIERLFGAIPTSLGFKHLIYDPKLNRFTTDSSYARKFSSE